MRIRLVAAVAATCSVGLLSSCVTLPSDTSPQVLRTFDAAQGAPSDLGPEPDREADLLLQDFYTVSAHPVDEYSGARSYLTPEVARQWNPHEGPVIVDKLFITAEAGGSADERSFTVRGRMVGRLSAHGAYRVENAEYEAKVAMHRVDGQWRIASLPEEVVIERTELLNHYEPHALYFYDLQGRTLVPDRRWLYSRGQSIDAELISLLLDGPSERLSPAVRPAAPGTAEFVGRSNGEYAFTGFEQLNSDQRLAFGAQLTWTLTNADVPQPYEVTLDNKPVAEGYDSLTPDDFPDLNPGSASAQSADLYALASGRLLSVSSTEAVSVSGVLGESDSLIFADISADGFTAAVDRSEDGVSLKVGEIDGEVTEVRTATSVSRPSIEGAAPAAWAAVDGDRVVRVRQDEETDQFQVDEVEMGAALSSLERAHTSGEISELQISPSGARVAFIVDGRLFIGIVVHLGEADFFISELDEIASELAGSALSVQWSPDGSLLVGTVSPDTPVWRVEYDGSASTALPAGNISAPVVAVASSATTMYATDQLGVRQLPLSGSGSGGSWRDVPGLRGMRSAPIVAD